MSKNDESEKKTVNSFTKMLVEISKMKSNSSNYKADEIKKVVDSIYLYRNVQNIQPDIIKTDKKFNQLYFTFLETILNILFQLKISNILIKEIAGNFTWYAKSSRTLPNSDGYCYLISRVFFIFPNIAEDKEIFDFFNTIFQIPAFISSFFFSKHITLLVNLFFKQAKESESIPSLITILRKKSVFPNNADSSSYSIIHQFAVEVENNKTLPETRILSSIQFISIYIEKLGKCYPNLINDLFLNNDFNIFYAYLVDHLQDDSFIQFIVSLLSIPSTTTSPNGTNSNDSKETVITNQITSPNQQVFNFLIQEFFTKPKQYEIQIKLIQSIYYFISEYQVDVNLFEPKNFFVTLYNMPTHNIPEIKSFLLDFFDMLVTYNYELSFNIFAIYLNEYKIECPFNRLSLILQHLITTFSFGNFNSNKNDPKQSSYLQNLPFFFVESFGDSPEKLGRFLSEFPIFQMLIVVLYQYKYSYIMNDHNPRLTWMKKIIECSKYFDHSNILIQMLTVDPSGDLINNYISLVKDHFSPSLFNVLTTTLHQSYFLVEQFLRYRGLQTIDKLLPSLDDDLLTNLLVSISSHPFSDELNESIIKLPNDHIFFHLKETKNYYRILRNSPIRLPVFLPFVPAPPVTYSQFDLMNISKYAVPIYQRFNKKVPAVFKLINRHLTYYQATQILRKNPFFIDSDSFASIGELIDMKADHFQLYEFLPNSQNVCVSLSAEITDKAKKSLVFWFKIVSPVYKKFSLFHTDKKSLVIDNDVLKVDSNHSIKIERNVWHSAVIGCKTVKIDAEKSVNFQDSSSFSQFVFGQSNVDCLWILSPNVRIVENNSIDDFLKEGPQFLKQTEKLPFVMIPNESILVDYAGLPYYFTLPSFFKNEFLDVIENCNDNNQVIGLFLLLLNVMVVNNQIQKYWPFVIHLLSTKTKCLNNYFISYIIDFISTHYTPKIFESFILNANFWQNLPDTLLSYTLNNLLSHSNDRSMIIFEFFVSLLLISISKNSEKQNAFSLSSSSSQSMDDSTIQIILFFLSRLSSQFPEEGFLKQLIEIVLFSEKYTFSLTVRLFFIQTALQNDVRLMAKSMPKNWILKLLSYFSNHEIDQNDADTFYFAVFDLLIHLSDNDIQNNFPQEPFDTTPFVFNIKYWHYFFAILTGKHPNFFKRIIDAYSNNSNIKTKIKIPSIIPSIISLTLHGLAVLVTTNFNPYKENPTDNSTENETQTVNEDNDYSFLSEYVSDSFKLLNQICENLPQLFQKDSICLFIQTICPLIPNLQSIFKPNIQLLHSEKFCVNMNDQQLILEETLRTWKITSSSQKEIIGLRPEISRFSLQSHSIIIPDRKCELFSKRISRLIQRIKNKDDSNNLENISSFKHIFHSTNFTQFSVNLLFANSDRFLELIYYLFGFCPFTSSQLFDEYFKLPFQIFISQLNQKNLNQNLFEQILKFIIQGFQINELYNVFSSSFDLLFVFLNNALGFISLDPNQAQNSNQNQENNNNNNPNEISHTNSTSNDDENSNNDSNLTKLVRDAVLLITKTGVQKFPNNILQLLLDCKNIINNEVIFRSYQMICQLISSLHVFYLSNPTSSVLFLKVLQSVWPMNDQSFKTYFVTNFSIEVYDSFQKAAVESDISNLSSILVNSSKTVLKLLSLPNNENSENSQKSDDLMINEMNQNFDFSSNKYDLYASYVYEVEKKELQANAEFTYLETAIDCSVNLKTVLYLHRCISLYEKNFTKYLLLVSYVKRNNIPSSINQSIYPFAWPFWVSRVLSPSYDVVIHKEANKFDVLNSFKISFEKYEFKVGMDIFNNDENTKAIRSSSLAVSDNNHNVEIENKIHQSKSLGTSFNQVLNDFYSEGSIESESNFNLIIFLKLYVRNINNKIYAFNARFIKNDIDINASVFILENKLLILLNSSIGDKFDRLIFNKVEYDDKLEYLFKNIINFEFGKFSFFYSHPLLSIHLDSILCAFEDNQTIYTLSSSNFNQKHSSKPEKINLNSFISLHIFSLKSSAFTLVASKKDLNILSNSLKPFIEANFESFSNPDSSLSNSIYFKKLETSDIFTRFENHQISSFEFIVLVNALYGKFFDNSKNLPVFPNLAKTRTNNKIRLKKGIIQYQSGFQYYSPDFLEFANKENNNDNNDNLHRYLENNVVYLNVEKYDMIQFVFENIMSLSSKPLLSNFLSSEFGGKLGKILNKGKSGTTINKIKKSLMKNRDNDGSDDEHEHEHDERNLSLSNGSDSDFLKKLKHFLSTNLHLFSFTSSSSFRAFNSDIHSMASSSSTFDSSTLKFSTRESVAVSRRGTFAVIDCPLRCCSEAFRVFYEERNKERPVMAVHMATFVYHEFARMKVMEAAKSHGEAKCGNRSDKEGERERKDDGKNSNAGGSSGDEAATENIMNNNNDNDRNTNENNKNDDIISTNNDNNENKENTNNNNNTNENNNNNENTNNNDNNTDENNNNNENTNNDNDIININSDNNENNENANNNNNNTNENNNNNENTNNNDNNTDGNNNNENTNNDIINTNNDNNENKESTTTNNDNGTININNNNENTNNAADDNYTKTISTNNNNNENTNNGTSSTDSGATSEGGDDKNGGDKNDDVNSNGACTVASGGGDDDKNGDENSSEASSNSQTANKTGSSAPNSSSSSSSLTAFSFNPLCHFSDSILPDFSSPHTIVDEHDFVAVTFWPHMAVIWDIVRGLPLHTIDFTSLDDIIDGMFEENNGLIAFCTRQSFFVYTVNGSFVMQLLLEGEGGAVKRIVSFEGFRIEYKTEEDDEKTRSLLLFMNENKK